MPRVGLFMAPLLLGACTLSSAMPPLSRDMVQVAPMSQAPASRAVPAEQERSIDREYDDSLDLSRYSVTTHKGKYFLWMQDPRLTFFVVLPGKMLDSLPAVVYLVFRTQSPQEVSDSKLHLSCGTETIVNDVVPRAQVVPGMLTSSLYQTFELPLDAFRQFSACQSGSVVVGGVEAAFGEKQFEQLRELVAVLPPS